ncbi:MAG: mechanosensitive ion channel [Pseudomonadales bacterium]|nr:mechanosensitive ion channel [Pseudomonadales bacterium]MCP5185168.1 mechanosensitive ion channel [Pseudomonadales bacterium]
MLAQRRVLLSRIRVCLLAGMVMLPWSWGNAAVSVASVETELLDPVVDESDRVAAQALLETARAEDRQAQALVEQTKRLRTELAGMPARRRELDAQIAIDRDRAVADWLKRLPTGADVDTLERVHAQEEATLFELGRLSEKEADAYAELLSKADRSTDEVALLRQQLATLDQSGTEDLDESALLRDARSARQGSERNRIVAELALRTLEQDTLAARQEIQALALKAVRAQIALHNARMVQLQARIATRATTELQAGVDAAAGQILALGSAPLPLRQLAVENHNLAEELAKHGDALSMTRLATPALEQARSDVAQSLEDSRKRLALGGASEAIGRWLWSERRRLSSPTAITRQLDAVSNTMGDLRLRAISIADAQRRLDDLVLPQRLVYPAGWPAADTFSVWQTLVKTHRQLLDDLSELVNRRIETLQRQEHILSDRLASTVELRRLLDRHLLWVRSHGPVDWDWVKRVPAGMADLFAIHRYRQSLMLMAAQVVNHPWTWSGCALLVLLLGGLRSRAAHAITKEAAVTRQVRRDSYRATARALAWTLVAAVPAPLLVFCLGRLLQSVGSAGYFSDSLGHALTDVSLPLYAARLVYWIAIERGLGHAHFRWLAARRQTLRTGLKWSAPLVLVLYFLYVLGMVRGQDLSADVTARLAILVAGVTLAWAAWNLLAPGRLWVVRGVDVEPSLLRKGTRVLATAISLGIVLLALTGFVHSAGILLGAMLDSFVACTVIALLAGLIARWFLLGERRLAYKRLLEQQEQATGESRATEPEVTLEQVNAQTGRLLRALRILLAVSALIFVWADVLPAIARLDETTLWHFSETVESGDVLQRAVTLMDLLTGLFVLVITVVGARNLPGLVEIGLLSRTRIDAASRYAITSILRYAIVIAGTLVGLSVLGMRWSQLQWLAAALSVGLGFGLQEIFANFVSGLILLFERPFRVGDIVTVDNLSGTVTRIRTRATTILDFDNKEIFVPNRTFITGQLINWTLSNAMTRVVIQVGVDYGSDTDLVHRLLMQVAQEHPRVVADPAPKSWFLSFGASSLDFELRVFVATIEDRLMVQDALNTRIAALFAEHGIGIAYPQLDVHIRGTGEGGAASA